MRKAWFKLTRNATGRQLLWELVTTESGASELEPSFSHVHISFTDCAMQRLKMCIRDRYISGTRKHSAWTALLLHIRRGQQKNTRP